MTKVKKRLKELGFVNAKDYWRKRREGSELPKGLENEYIYRYSKTKLSLIANLKEGFGIVMRETGDLAFKEKKVSFGRLIEIHQFLIENEYTAIKALERNKNFLDEVYKEEF